ncbi:hypothetical protein [Lentzea xinjiangensis]|uniref:hypothetical protein n=1 Tax=Lentzea xinjiangensis TaxID=402600 RepID=UPI0015A559DD|nr:hypothetical protein [Lentzea xinjiangensis]
MNRIYSAQKELEVHDLDVTFTNGEGYRRDHHQCPARPTPELGVRAVGGRPAKDQTAS